MKVSQVSGQDTNFTCSELSVASSDNLFQHGDYVACLACQMVFGGLVPFVLCQMNTMTWKLYSCIHMVLLLHSNGHREKMFVGWQTNIYYVKFKCQ